MRYIIGVDEVGRGPLAGPITVGVVAVIANAQFKIKSHKLRKTLCGIKDSKKLSVKKREKWRDKLLNDNGHRTSIWCVVASVGPKTIDNVGISRAARHAVSTCLRRLEVRLPIGNRTSNYKILLDGGLCAPRVYLNQKTIIKGDEKIPIIAAASIIAKIYRDKTMVRYHNKFPEYRFDLHKGYGTNLHCELVRKLGLSDIHRKTFCRNI
ncbi:MAG: ribonuclease HII [Patescibacteria group bacterium]